MLQVVFNRTAPAVVWVLFVKRKGSILVNLNILIFIVVLCAIATLRDPFTVCTLRNVLNCGES